MYYFYYLLFLLISLSPKPLSSSSAAVNVCILFSVAVLEYNIAPRGDVTQFSHEDTAHFATDVNFNQCARTAKDEESWLLITFQKIVIVSEVVILSQPDWCGRSFNCCRGS